MVALVRLKEASWSVTTLARFLFRIQGILAVVVIVTITADTVHNHALGHFKGIVFFQVLRPAAAGGGRGGRAATARRGPLLQNF